MSLDVAGSRVQTILVLGLGVTGRAVVTYCLEQGLTPRVSDAHELTADARSWLREASVPFEEGGHAETLLAGADAVVLSPGVPVDHPIVSAAEKAGVLVLSELDLAWSQAFSTPIVAVTGTNGKGTTVTLIDAILRQAGLRTRLGGNIGTPFISLLAGIEACDAVVLEASSFQLEGSRFLHPRVGVLLNLTPDHLDRHGSMGAYAAAKGRLFRLQGDHDVAVLPVGLRDTFRQARARKVHFDAPPPTLPPGAARLSPHNRSNLAAAITAVGELDPGLDLSRLSLDALEDAFSLPHRMQRVGSIGRVQAIDDSKSTNADSAIAALRAVEATTVLLVGGRHKGGGYDSLAREIRKRDVRRVVVFGEAADDLADLLEPSKVVIVHARSVEDAVDVGLASARPGDTLLFSPACSSFDAFRDYADRGETFVRAIRARSGASEK
ncbi:MAG: UDP-N-acetylmuramoyl-L-alanine--D-glutamate ligase [Candidatus Bipolaricaulia bacterium]